MLNIRKEIFIRRRKIELGEDYMDNQSDISDINLLPFKKELFAMPVDPVNYIINKFIVCIFNFIFSLN